LKDLSR